MQDRAQDDAQAITRPVDLGQTRAVHEAEIFGPTR